MRCHPFLILLLTAVGACTAGPRDEGPRLIARPEAFETLVNPDCSHCVDEAQRRADLRADDRVLAWTRGYSDGGAIPVRFFLNPYRVISDSYGVFVYDPEAGYARGFAPWFHFRFHGWRNGVMVMKDLRDGTLYSCLSGLAFEGPKKGTRLTAVPTIVSDWGTSLERYPHAVAYHMYPKYQPVELPTTDHADSIKSRAKPDPRLPDEAMVLGVWDGRAARAYPLQTLADAGFLAEQLEGRRRVILWDAATRTAAAYEPAASPPRKYAGPQPNDDGVSPPDPAPQPAAERRSVTLARDDKDPAAPFVDAQTGSRWDVAGRAVAGELKGWTLEWVDSTQVKWFAWAAEYPETSIYPAGRRAAGDAAADAKPLEAVLVGPDGIDDAKVAGWRAEGFRAVAVVLDEQTEAAILEKTARAIAAGSMELYYWIEIARHPDTARAHPEWMASLGMHPDWRTRFPDVREVKDGEVAKAWPWVPIGYRESFDAHLARIDRLLARVPSGYRGILLNDLQGGPAACGCGNLQCRWAIDYHVPATATRMEGLDVAAQFVAAVKKAAKGKEVIPVWTIECQHEDMSPEEQGDPAAGWSSGYCGDVGCLDNCGARFTEQWSALRATHRGPVGVLALHKEFGRDRKEYGDSGAGWIASAAAYLEEHSPKGTQPPPRPWLVVQGYGVTPEEEAAVRRTALRTTSAAVLVARTRIDQSFEPRIVDVKARTEN